MSVDQQNAPLGTEKDGFRGPDSPPLCNLLDEVAEEIAFDWPEHLPVERIVAGIMGIALGLLLLGSAAFCASHLKLSARGFVRNREA